MPANPEQLHAALRRVGETAKAAAAAATAANSRTLELLGKWATQTHELRQIVEAARVMEPDLRCAVPHTEALDARHDCPSATAVIITAVDGSQIVPSRHEEILYGLINIGGVSIRIGSGKTPDVFADTRLLFGDEVLPEGGPVLGEGDIALMRDAAERAALLRRAPQGAEPWIGLTDGPLELWGGKDVSDPKAFEAALSAYVADLHSLEDRRCILAGYIDKPGANLVVRLLEVASALPRDMKDLRAFHPDHGASDRMLFGGILGSGQRSAVFAMQSRSTKFYAGMAALYFFYLNVGSAQHPVVARVEVPRWVADNPPYLEALHAALIDQCRALGSRPYPYILQRAHETARIGWDEREQIKARILLELRNGGLETDSASYKSSAKAAASIKGSY